ncbi:GMC oxidoreductase [Viridothelium virens]|uniref:GMC oxidoreductase n=1 Tax=Viridothelium virens TaxID=1048519 RepID=A0A6A6H0P8_VIRVR|nr:GMC oxidoreductase [Viridothelium virens]
MLTWTLLSVVFAAVAFSAPHPYSKRQLSGILAGLQGAVGQNASFDYVVVGGGTGGLAIAKRLAEDPQTTVAVIEAGSLYEVTSPLIASTPGGDVLFCGSDAQDNNPLIDWSFFTQPQKGGNGRTTHYARGKCLGGSSARNFMIYQRGTVDSYQKWADQVGDQSYTWDNLQQYFKKSVAFTPPNTAKRASNASAQYNPSAFSPTAGPLSVSYANYAQPFSSYIQGSFSEIGIPTVEDFNSGSLLGAQYCSSTINPSNENRDSSQTSFLDAASAYSNLKVYTASVGEKILFDGNKTATGVRASSAGVPFILSANKEVIVSAGAFQSPQVLMLSGVGPAAQLQSLGIPVVADRPGVGENLTDHVFFGPSYPVQVDTLTKLANDDVYTAAQLTNFTTFQEGPFTNPVADFLGWEKVPQSMRSNFSAQTQAALAQFPADWPEIEYISASGYVGDFGDLFMDQPKDGRQYATILGTLVAPLSRGTVTLSSTSAADLPLIDPNWLTDPTDQAVAIAAYKRVRAAFASKFMQQIVIGDEYFPGKAVQSDADILNTIANTVQTVWHASVTCRMGSVDDPNAVVDSKARVIGVQGVRVVDASAFALLPPGHPQSTIYMLAEKIADDIKNGQ